MEDILVPIFCGCVLPVAIVLIVSLRKKNSDDKRAILTSGLMTDVSYVVFVLSWLLIGGLSGKVAINTYNLSSNLLTNNLSVLGSSPSGDLD